MSKPHKHAEVIKAWADGAQIEYRTHAGMDWMHNHGPSFDCEFEYRVKPEPPAKVYPETRLCTEDLYEIWKRPAMPVGALTNVANAALRHAIDAGQLVDPATYMEDVRTLAAKRNSRRDMEIAEVVRMAAWHVACCCNNFRESPEKINALDLSAIIAKVKP